MRHSQNGEPGRSVVYDTSSDAGARRPAAAAVDRSRQPWGRGLGRPRPRQDAHGASRVTAAAAQPAISQSSCQHADTAAPSVLLTPPPSPQVWDRYPEDIAKQLSAFCELFNVNIQTFCWAPAARRCDSFRDHFLPLFLPQFLPHFLPHCLLFCPLSCFLLIFLLIL